MNDPTDQAFLDREHVGEADIVVATMDSDETNLLVTLLAKRLGAPRAMALVTNSEYINVFEAIGVDAVVNPREETVGEIVRFTRGERTERVAFVGHGRAEMLELTIDEESELAHRPIQETVAEFPGGVLITADVYLGSPATRGVLTI